MNAVQLARESLAFVHTLVELEIDKAQPGSGVVSGAAIYAHTILDEDHFVAPKAGGPLVFESGSWRGRLGFEPFAAIEPAWAEGVRCDLTALREYAESVYRRSDEFLAGLSEADANRPVQNWQVIRENGGVRYAERQVPLVFGLLDNVALHSIGHAGEIAVVMNLARKA
jgi:hypothetical protein